MNKKGVIIIIHLRMAPGIKAPDHSLYIRFLKPVWEWIAAFILLLFFIPIMILLALVLYRTNEGKIFFLQKRIGYKEKSFTLLKFKTMRDRTDEAGIPLPDCDRMFAFGNFMRLYHLDELPQLINVLRGQLSLCGPRPLLPEYLFYYSSLQRIRHYSRPGIIGLAQVMGGNKLSWHQRFRYDIFYSKHAGLKLDLLVFKRLVTYLLQRGNAENKVIFSESFIDFKLRQASKAA